MEQEKQNGKQETVPVYLSFKTFQSAIQSLRTHGLPDSLDRTAFGSRSGAEQTQILSAFRFLGLLNESNRTQESLRALVKAKENTPEEKAILSSILTARYGNAIALNLEAATPAQLNKAIAEYGAGGATLGRAVRFFVKACENCGIKLSPRLTARKPRSANNTSGDDQGLQGKTERGKRRLKIEFTPPVTTNIKTVSLPGVGGNLTVSGTFNYFELEGEERTLVLGIIDMLKKFEKSQESDDEKV
jgi:hypothetical protein